MIWIRSTPLEYFSSGLVIESVHFTSALASLGWDRSMAKTLAAMLAGTLLIFTPGILWLSSFIGFEKAVAAGLIPFLLSESLKIMLAVLVMPLIWKRLSD